MNKYNIGDKVKRVKKVLTVDTVQFSNYARKYIYTFENYHLWAYENEIMPIE